MKYRKGYKYQLAEDEVLHVEIYPRHYIKTDFITLSKGGKLTLKKGYACDGPTDPAIDTKSFMRGSFAHDALYQLMRLELLPLRYRVQADRELKRICLEDGMWRIRAWWVYRGLQAADGAAALPENAKPILEAP